MYFLKNMRFLETFIQYIDSDYRSLILTPALIKTWVNPHKLWRKNYFVTGDLTVYVFYFISDGCP